MIPASVEHAIYRVMPEWDDTEAGRALRDEMKREVMKAVVEDLASFCLEQNGRFDRDRWMAYIAGECGPNGGKVDK